MFKKIYSLFLIFFIMLNLVSCGGKIAASNAKQGDSTATAAAGAARQNKTPGTRTITDQAGRSVVVPSEIMKVYSVSPVGTVFMHTLAPDKIAGLSWELTEGEKKYTTESFQKLPVLGGTFGKDKTMNREVVLKANPDIILNMGDLDQKSFT